MFLCIRALAMPLPYPLPEGGGQRKIFSSSFSYLRPSPNPSLWEGTKHSPELFRISWTKTQPNFALSNQRGNSRSCHEDQREISRLLNHRCDERIRHVSQRTICFGFQSSSLATLRAVQVVAAAACSVRHHRPAFRSATVFG